MDDKIAGEAAKLATSNCEARAVSKDGKVLSGDAKTAFMKKCEKDVQDITKSFEIKIDEAVAHKEKEVMEV